MTVFRGDDRAEDRHDVHLPDDDGKMLASRRRPDGLQGIRMFHELVADLIADSGEVIVRIETDRGSWVTALVAPGDQVHAINPLARSRHHPAALEAFADLADQTALRSGQLAAPRRSPTHSLRPLAQRSGSSPD